MNDQTPMLELVTLDPKTALAMFACDNPQEAFAPILGKIKAIVDDWERPDCSSEASRKEIASMAYKVARSKGALEVVGKELAAEAKKVPGKIDASRRYIAAYLDNLRDDIREPLDAWEAAEEARQEKHRGVLSMLQSIPLGVANMPAGELRRLIGETEAINPAEGEEYAAEIEIAKATKLNALIPALAARSKADTDAAELEALRKEKAERERQDREAAIAKEAAEKAEARVREEAAENTRKLEAAKEAAEKAAVDAAAKAKRDLEAQKQAELEAQRAREKNTAHRRAINKEAVAALVGLGLGEVEAKAVVTAIAKGAIPNVTISY